MTLAPGGTGHILLTITYAGNFQRPIFDPATATGLRVYAPGDYTALQFPFSFRACATRGPVYLDVTALAAGTGVPGYTG